MIDFWKKLVVVSIVSFCCIYFFFGGGGLPNISMQKASMVGCRGRHQKRYSDNATLRFALSHTASTLRRKVSASYSYRSRLIEIVLASYSYRSVQV